MTPCEPPNQKTRRSAKSHWPNRKSLSQKEIQFHGVEDGYKKSLKISEPGGMLELNANLYRNLGSVYKQRGDIAGAREYWARAVGLYERIGMPHMVTKVWGLIEGLSQDRQ